MKNREQLYANNFDIYVFVDICRKNAEPCF